MIPGERVIRQPDPLSPTPAPVINPDEKEPAAAPQDSHSSTIYPDPIPHTTQAPAATIPTLTDDQICGIELLEGEFMKIVTADGPEPIADLEKRLMKFNQTLQPQLTPEQVREIINQEQAKLEKKIFETGVHPAKLRDLIRKCHLFGESDIGNGERFAARWAETARYCHPRKAWYLWDGTRWREDQERAVYRKAKVTARAIYREVDLFLTEDDAKRRERSRWAASSAGKKRLEDMLFLATSDEKISVHPDNLDADGNLFNLTNGTLDLTAPVTFREHRKEDLLTKMAGVAYDPAADCPLWDAHFRRMFDGKEDLIQALQEHIGYCLLSGNPSHVFEIWYGEAGFNGKSATLKTLNRIFGTYATPTDANTFMVSKREGNAPKPELLALRGARIVTAAESEKGAVLATGIVKQMTGGDPISARGLFKDTEIFFPEFTPIIATNNAPRIQDKTNAIWGRIKCWPFTVTIPEEQRIPDFDIRLFEEGSGILNWMIKGLKRYYAAGCQLAEPPELLASTNEYRADQDTVLKFIEARCTLGPKENVAQSLLYLEFETWCDETGEFAVSKKDFFKSFKDRKHRFYSPGNVRSIQGIRIKTSREIEEWDQQQNES